jgi:hypothetical protein
MAAARSKWTVLLPLQWREAWIQARKARCPLRVFFPRSPRKRWRKKTRKQKQEVAPQMRGALFAWVREISQADPESNGSPCGICRICGIVLPRRTPLFQPSRGFRQFFGDFPQENCGSFFRFRRQIVLDKLPQTRKLFVQSPANLFKFVHGGTRWRVPSAISVL